VAFTAALHTDDMRRGRLGKWLGPVVWLAAASACATSSPLSRLTRQASPYEQYVDGLREAGLDVTALGQDWIAAGDRALRDAAPASAPFAETGYFEPATPSARAWRLDVVRGRRLSVDVQLDAASPARLFVDLFARRDDGTHERVTSLEPGSATLTHEIERDGTYVIRLQPELLRGGRYQVSQRTLASLAVFPVHGLSPDAVQSAFGVERDAGRRLHEGLDIFAPRGTAVVAVVDGHARPATNGLGGTVMWLHEARAGRTFYYAHLDRWAFEDDRRVVAGEVLGYVGNTGNARTTGPHLHFGIYSDGAIDPLPFVHADDPVPDAPTAPDRRGTRVRVGTARASLRTGAQASAPPLRELPRGTLATVIGGQARTYRVQLPDGLTGYLDATAVSATTAPLARQRVTAGTALREAPIVTAPVVTTAQRTADAAVIGRFDAFALVTTDEGATGWIDGVAPPR
jgi:murein DD-endopeptidase MepM/ murein hydrolase activator NlpD